MANKQAISYERHYYLYRIWWATFCLFTEVSRNFSNKRDCYYPANEVFGERHFDYSLKSAEISQSSAIVITARKRSCGKVMFLHLSVILFTGGGVSVGGVSIQGSLWLQGGCLWLQVGCLWLQGGVSDCRGVSLTAGGLCQGDTSHTVKSGRYASCWNAFLFDWCRQFLDRKYTFDGEDKLQLKSELLSVWYIWIWLDWQIAFGSLKPISKYRYK